MAPTISTILVPTDFSVTSKRALAYAHLLAERFGAALHIVHVCEAPVLAAAWSDGYALSMLQLREQIMKSSEEQLLLLAAAQGAVPSSTEVLTGAPARAIVELARDRGVSLIVMGTHGHSAINHLLLGSVAERVVRTASCPVLTVREASTDSVEPPAQSQPSAGG